MHHRTTLIGALCALFFLAFSATTALAAPAPAKAPAPVPAAMKATAPAPAAMEAKAPAPTAKPAPVPTGKASAGATAEPPSMDKPSSEPAPGPTPSPAAGVSKPWSPDEADDPHRAARRGHGQDHRLTSIVVPIAFFLALLLLVGTIQYMGFRKDRNKHQTLRLMVEKGARIPVELITTQKRQGSDLRRGLVLVGAGLGIMLAIAIAKGASNGGVGLGLIPALIGAGYLLAWKLEGRKQAAQVQPTLGYDHNPELATTQRDDPDALSSGALPTDTDNDAGDR